MIKRLIFLYLLYGLSLFTAMAQQVNIDDRAEDLLSKMTLEEKVSYLSGNTSFSLRAIPRLGIPIIRLADGPQGIRNFTAHSTLYPAGILTASTWNRQLAHRLGVSLGMDARARGVSILLGPGVNIYRSPLCGRNYEYFGEDPYLVSETAKEYILGVQSQGVIATIKHFCANNQEWNRHHVSSDIDERTLNEIYFPAFKKAVQEAHVGAVMNSYNLLGGVHSTENKWLNIDVLRDTWGFKGILMSDWSSVYSTVNAANNGLDLEMPKGKFFNCEKLIPCIKKGLVDEHTIDTKVRHLLTTFLKFGLLDSTRQAGCYPLNNLSSRQTALAIAREGIVLLKNENHVLPLLGRTAVMGSNANVISTGGGSGFVSPYVVSTISDALKRRRKNTVLLTDDVIYTDITSQVYTDSSRKTYGFNAEYYDNQDFKGDSLFRVDPAVDFDWGYSAPLERIPEDHFSVTWTGYYYPRTSEEIRLQIGGDDGYRVFVNDSLIVGDWGNHAYSSREVYLNFNGGEKYKIVVKYFDNVSTAKIKMRLFKLNREIIKEKLEKVENIVYCTGFNSDVEGEGFDRSFSLPDYQNNMIRQLAETGKKIIVVLNAGGAVNMSSWLSKTQAVLMAWYTGQEGGTALADILLGKISPSGKLPISMESRWEDNPCFENYYVNVGNKECKTVEYREGIFVGYRGYDKSGIKPLFPFGYGLSYTTFKYSNLKIEKYDSVSVKVSFDITNTGNMDGKEASQLYVHECNPIVPRPEKELKGYDKVFIPKGESRHIEIKLQSDAFAYYDVASHQFKINHGIFEIRVGTSSADTPLVASVML
ncbi:MAG: glycoside hydrolase family 3 C-terminal domain-containing protein [Prevotella sp.]|jgi:beta-glucosidase|nr:glycoside hydrolase family 3 C-terminal domain-containing protein [Prevotella sp.]MCI1281925.1 glycoside hydrolase family 3 C-terminal domain-containing protein [Prevotella sp.]